jgi:FixJ family two-component response regulator
VLLTNVVMPGINGKELANRLAAVRTDTKTNFMSGCASEVVSDAGVLVPVDAFVAKPFTVERLLKKVRERIEYCSPFPRPRLYARRPDPSGREIGPAPTATPD